MDRMQQQWNLQNFKYQLLIDMWAMRVRFMFLLLRLCSSAIQLQTSCCILIFPLSNVPLPCRSWTTSSWLRMLALE